MNQRLIRIMGGFLATSANVITIFSHAFADNPSSLKCGATSGTYYQSEHSVYTCVYQAVSGTCVVANTNTTANSIFATASSSITAETTYRYYVPSQSSGLSWCSGGYAYVAPYGAIPGWETNFPHSGSNAILCCSISSGIFAPIGTGGGSGAGTSDIAISTGATMHIPNIQFAGCERSYYTPDKTYPNKTSAQKICASGFSGDAALPYLPGLQICCPQRCPGATTNGTNDTLTFTQGTNDPATTIHNISGCNNVASSDWFFLGQNSNDGIYWNPKTSDYCVISNKYASSCTSSTTITDEKGTYTTYSNIDKCAYGALAPTGDLPSTGN